MNWYHTKQPLNAININPCQDGISALYCRILEGKNPIYQFSFKVLEWTRHPCLKINEFGRNSEKMEMLHFTGIMKMVTGEEIG